MACEIIVKCRDLDSGRIRESNITIENEKVLMLVPGQNPPVVAILPDDLVFNSATKKWKLSIDDSGVITTVEQV